MLSCSAEESIRSYREFSELQANCVEQETRDQQHSHLWYIRMRCGRITALELRAACCTDPCAPSKS